MSRTNWRETVISFLSKLLRKAPPAPAKDPMDWRHTPANSTEWYTGTYCPQCKGWTEHRDIMANICHACGCQGSMRRYRSSREIWDGEKWVVQHKYDNGPTDYALVPKRRV